MAEENHDSGGVPETVTFIVLLLLVLGALSWIRNGPPTAAHGGIFFQPSAPATNAPSTGAQPQGADSSNPGPNLRY